MTDKEPLDPKQTPGEARRGRNLQKRNLGGSSVGGRKGVCESNTNHWKLPILNPQDPIYLMSIIGGYKSYVTWLLRSCRSVSKR
jgi:hypothetical protein